MLGHRRADAAERSLVRRPMRPVFRLALLLALALVPATLWGPGTAAAAPSLEQARAHEIGSGSTNSVTFENPNKTGATIVVFVLWENAGAVSLADSRGNTYLPATERATWAGGASGQTFYASNIVAGTNTVTATFSTPIQSWAIVQAHEYSGLDRANPLISTHTRSGIGETMTAGPVNTTAPDGLLFAAGGSAGAMTTIPPGFTARLNTSGNRTMDQVVEPGAHSISTTHTGGDWILQLTALRADTGADTTPPGDPSGLAATATSPSEVTLMWNPATDNTGVADYRVERCTGADCTSFTQIAAPSSTTYTDTGLAAGTTYRYRVRAADTAGNLGAYSTIAEVSTPVVEDSAAPSAPTSVTGTAASISRIDLSWNPSGDDVGVAGYRVFRNGTLAGTTATPSFSDTGLTVGTAYRYEISAYDAAGNESALSAPSTVRTADDTTPPSVPTGARAQVVSSTQINISWDTSTDDVGVSGYRLYRDGVFLKSSSVTPVQDPGLTPSTTYRYEVSAYDTAGNESTRSAAVFATTPDPDNTPPSATMTAPMSGSTVNGTVTVSATASDNVGVAEVDFLLDGVSIGVDTTAPYSVTWDSRTTSNDQHTLSARARDTAGNFGVTSGVVTITVANSSAPSLPSGMVAGWNFDESAGDRVADVTGNGNTLALRGSPTWVAGRYGAAVDFDGTGEYAVALNSPTLNISGSAMTFSAWVKPSGGGGDQVLFGKFYNAGMSTPYYQYGIELSGTTPIFFIGTSSGLAGAGMGSALRVGEWSHLATVFDGDRLHFYVNGDLVSSPPLDATITPRDSVLHLGADASPTQFFTGALDDVRVYTRALDTTEVRADRDTALISPGSDPTAPTVRISAPVNGAQVGGVVTLLADASDDAAIASVQFYVDGLPVGPADVAEPYGANWDTREAANGAHTVTARAQDTAGNITMSTPITLNVANSDYFQNEILATGLELPVSIKFLPDGRMLVAELPGKIKVLPPPYTNPDPVPFLEITNISGGGVRHGIFDVELDPDFATNRYFYVFYTAGDPFRDRVSRFTANAALTGTVPGSEVVLWTDSWEPGPEHHGGAVTVANDGTVLFTVGEHFNPDHSQRLNDPRGKVHRINRDGSIPADNPFFDGTGPNVDSIWAYGLRNPFRASYDRPTGRLFIGDVGGNVGDSNEEVNLGAPGANYGWPDYEGPCPSPCISPIYDWEHNNRDASVTGGFIYRGTQFPASMRGDYFFADYAQNWIKRLTFDQNGDVAGVFPFEPASGDLDGPTGDVVYLTEGPDGALYYLDLGYSDVTGTFGVSKVRRIRYLRTDQAPVAVASADRTSGTVPLSVAFSSSGSADPEGADLTYAWDFGDGSVSSAASPSHTYTRAGSYTVRLTVSDGVNSTFAPPLTITAGSPPTASVTLPTDGRTFRAGDVMIFAGEGTDPDDGTLTAEAHTWTIDFLHDGHVHPVQQLRGVRDGSFTVPANGHDFSGNTRYRISLTVTDSSGLTDTGSVIVWPEKTNLTFDTEPSGLTLHLDGIARSTPFVHDSLVGFEHSVEARDQSRTGTSYSFSSWSNGGARSQSVTVPSAGLSLTASYIGTSMERGPVGAWSFDDGTGTSAQDSSGNGNTLTLRNGAGWITGHDGGALHLDGTDDFATAPDSPALDIAGTGLTLSMWIKPDSVVGDSVVIGKPWTSSMTDPYYQYGVELSGGRPVFLVGTSGGVRAVSADRALTAGQWSHLAVVFDGTRARFFVDGLPAGSGELEAALSSRTTALRLGADASPWQFLPGSLDDLRVYDRAVTDSQIGIDMSTPVTAPAP